MLGFVSRGQMVGGRRGGLVREAHNIVGGRLGEKHATKAVLSLV